ncbi:MAG: transaldolase family protein, partial [Desulfobaccales bacterium]
MKFFIDTADLEEIREAHDLGLVDGVTTNPSLCAKAGIKTDKQFEKLISQICELVQGPVSAEVTATDEAGMLQQARHLAKIHQW